MYPSIHSLAHRAPPATRTRVRWQPYNSLPTTSASSFTSRSPSSTYLNTPTSSVSSSPSPIPSRTCDSERAKIPQQRDPAQSREKNKYALSLVDQAVKSLHEIWHPQDIPVVFLTSSRATVPGTTTDSSPPCNSAFNSVASHSSSSSTQLRNKQLPSPNSPTTHPSPPNSSPTPSTTQCNDSLEALLNPRNMVPMKGFVHEVLRRSRTSGTVLQTALCYLEAIRGKVPELIRQEKAGEGLKGELELDSRITPATEAELELEALSSTNSSCSSGLPTLIVNDAGDVMDTVKVSYSDDVDSIDTSSTSATAYGIGEAVAQSSVEDDTSKKPKATSPSLTPLPPLPSPLLCPRRAFLAALILASKFTQDKCYSNRAWAKLSGLPPREIGRCERALGDALDWRLWVGKSPAPSSPATSASTTTTSPSSTPPVTGTGNSRPVSRCHSESNLRSSASERSAFLVTDKVSSHQRTLGPVSARPLATRSGSGLRRASTLPVEIFASSPTSSFSGQGSYHSRLRSNNVVAQWISGQSHADRSDQEMYSPEVESTKSEFEVSPCLHLLVRIAFQMDMF
ncbi:hypothetical protein E1B28_000685 [Marasmius oreades]|uniref:Uncharacterized protein n=1 Tax=Marasmius oreades TaxID=181124 RepID=A0A9P7V1Z4_9AGAR|nr:uncharacterized protein E1B28_000685 [Marasmius oreades]KAG7098778.1 hypothetical protein E1B28_000685 [Marasmius oreades]